MLTSRTPDRWIFTQGDFTSRAALHERYGGSRMSGITPTTKSTHVFLFGMQHAPGSGWRDDGFYYYAGACGRSGSANWESHPANKAIETAWSRGRRLQILEAPAVRRDRLWRFVDSFMLEDIAGELTAAHHPGGPPARYPLFRLRSIDSVTHRPGQLLPPGDPRYVDVRRVERCDLLCREARATPLTRERPETRLSKAFERHVMSQGYAVHRLGIRHTAGCSPMLTDTWIAHLDLLIEAKAGPNPTDDVRMAIGQLAHYTRHTPGVLRKAILLPAEPDRELIELVRDMGADTIWPHGDTWCTTGRWSRLIGLTRHTAR
ncbi:hypothetical protein JHN52_14435 [Streptomyces sp. MBT97]|uniref:hypothetical protein n=1 Tax=Streptomyces sp. MBT97 TaxID=2800411 RepID=UPI00190C9D89|nr:hypothetical protein [Streptomyces sp. MBT97]MBK3634126.1 hypothetical protein [Streptomyces sp. MBT97]